MPSLTHYIRSVRYLIRRTFFKSPLPQEGEVIGRYYKRTGHCNGCGECCKNIHLVHDEKTVTTLDTFEAMKRLHTEYEAFIPVAEDSDGLIFECSNLNPDNTCQVYDNRPDFCQNYPNEEGLLRGGSVPKDCSYHFELLKSFRETLSETQASVEIK